MRLGKIRLGDKGPKGEPRKLTKFRLTSPARALLEAAAIEYGGDVKDWEGAPDEGVFELYTDTDTLDIILPPVFSDRDGSPTLPYSQAYELWSGGGCQRRCDGETEVLSNKPCLCDPDERTCKIVTRLNVMLPKIPGLGVWMMESHGYNAAAMLPGTLDLLMLAASQQRFIPAVLRLEQRTSKKGGQTRKFVVPVIDLPELRMSDVLANGLAAATSPAVINGPVVSPGRPELPAGEAPPSEPEAFDNDSTPEFGEPPPIVEAEELVAVPTVEIAALRDELIELVQTLGATDALPAIAAHVSTEDTPWLKRQIATAKKAVAALPPEQDELSFAGKAQAAQARRKARTSA